MGLTDEERVLEVFFGYSHFREGQHPIVKAILGGSDTMAVMATGFGKSVCFQVPALLSERCAIVICPILALMDDQVAALRARNIPAYTYNSTQTPAQHAKIRKLLSLNKVSFLYVSPEMLANKGLLKPIILARPKLVIIDEAHCASQWGSDFRPAYTEIGSNVEVLEKNLGYRIQRVCFTATATDQVQADICRYIGMESPKLITGSMRRSNLRYQIRRTLKKGQDLEEVHSLLGNIREEPTIIYAPTIKKVTEIMSLLDTYSIEASMYHGKMGYPERAEVSKKFISKEINLVVATDAFGMGIDRPDVRFVINVGMPLTIEAYIQQAGRAGRDGEPAYCILISTGADSFIHELFLSRMIVAFDDASTVYHKILGSKLDVLPSRPTRIASEIKDWDNCVEAWDIGKLLNHLVLQGSLVRKRFGRENGVALRKPIQLPLAAMTRQYNSFVRARSEQALDYGSNKVKTCLPLQLERYLASNNQIGEACGVCSNCATGLVFGREHAAIIRCIKESGRMYGSTALKHMLTGNRGYFSVRKQKLEKISTYGALKHLNFKEVGVLFNELREARLIDRPNNLRAGFFETSLGEKELSKYIRCHRGPPAISGRNRKVLLREAIESTRASLANEEGCDPDNIWSTEISRVLVENEPQTFDELKSMYMIPSGKIALYGHRIIKTFADLT